MMAMRMEIPPVLPRSLTRVRPLSLRGFVHNMRVRHSTRPRSIYALLSCLAILGQLLLPTLHAQTLARQNGDPLLFAICGQVNPALLAEMRRVTPPEVARKLQQDHAAESTADCALCLSVHGGVPLGGSVVSVSDPATAFAAPTSPVTAVASTPQLRLPPSRGPPSLS